MQVKDAIYQVRIDRMPTIHQEKKQIVGGGHANGGFWKDKLEKDTNTDKIC